jgi:hypothetical protein
MRGNFLSCFFGCAAARLVLPVFFLLLLRVLRAVVFLRADFGCSGFGGVYLSFFMPGTGLPVGGGAPHLP